MVSYAPLSGLLCPSHTLGLWFVSLWNFGLYMYIPYNSLFELIVSFFYRCSLVQIKFLVFLSCIVSNLICQNIRDKKLGYLFVGHSDSRLDYDWTYLLCVTVSWSTESLEICSIKLVGPFLKAWPTYHMAIVKSRLMIVGQKLFPLTKLK